MITPVAQTVLGHEKAMGLYETEEQSPDSKGFRRYQIIHVLRDGNLAEFRTDMGRSNSKKWKGVKLLRIPSFWEHTVDYLMNLADELRNEDDEDDVFELLGLHRKE